MKLLRNAGLYVAHLAVAVFGSMIVGSRVGRIIGWFIHERSMNGRVEQALILSVVYGVVLGFLVYWQWMWKAAIWLWIIPSIFFALASIAAQRLHGGWWYWVSGMACEHGEYNGCKDLTFTILFLQSTGYSIGTLMASWLIPGRRVAN